MSNFIPDIILALLGVLILAAAIFVFVRMSPEKRKALFTQIIFSLAVEAERLYGSKTGQAKKQQVVAWFYERYRWLAIFIAEDVLSEKIDKIAEEMTTYFKENPDAAYNILGYVFDQETGKILE